MHVNIYNSKGKLRKQVKIERIVPARTISPRFKADYFAALLADGTHQVNNEQHLDQFYPGWRGLLETTE